MSSTSKPTTTPTSKPKPKGILKNRATTPSTTSTTTNKPKSQTTPDPREVAIKHAQIIHSRREIEEHISESMLSLSHYPLDRSASYSASNPSPSDAESFKTLVRLYQPGDYDDLIEERNANGLCGYALCPNPRFRASTRGAATFKLVNYGRRDFNIVPSRELERWCSQRCARRAMYVKVQLNETAAWERAGIASIQIELFEEEEQQPQQSQQRQQAPSSGDAAADQLAKDVRNMKIQAAEKTVQNARDLALERGDNPANGEISKRKIKLAIREKPAKAPAAPSLDPHNQSHLMTEGYKTTFDPKSETVSQEGQTTIKDGTKPDEPSI